MLPLEKILRGFPEKKALVVGDICLDRWCSYDPAASEPSRETGIPRTAVIRSEVTPGAGGTIANNLAALGTGVVSVLGILGDDGNGWELRRALHSRGIHHDLCITNSGVCTFTYTKLLNSSNGIEDQPRIDFINSQPMPAAAEDALLSTLRQAAADFDVILVSDQAETETGGVITPQVRHLLSALAVSAPEKVVWVDSRLRPEHFRHVIVKPNEDEATAACLRIPGALGFARLRSHMEAPSLWVTHGPKGVLILQESGETWVPTVPVPNPVDICGAGDSFTAGAAVALAITRDPLRAAQFGNLVASVTIMKKGTGTASPDELREAFARHPS